MRDLAKVGNYRMLWLVIGLILLAGFSIWAINDGGSELFFQRVFDGLGNGFIYSAMALALVLIFKATGVVNFAQGEMAMFGAFIAYAIANAFGIPGAVAVLIAMVLSAIVAAGIERVLIRPFDPSNHLAIAIVTLSLFLILNAIAGVIWAFDGRALPSLVPGAQQDVRAARRRDRVRRPVHLDHRPRRRLPRHPAAEQDEDRPGVPRRVVATWSRASCSASTSGARCSSAGRWPPRWARWPAR